MIFKINFKWPKWIDYCDEDSFVASVVVDIQLDSNIICNYFSVTILDLFAFLVHEIVVTTRFDE